MENMSMVLFWLPWQLKIVRFHQEVTGNQVISYLNSIMLSLVNFIFGAFILFETDGSQNFMIYYNSSMPIINSPKRPFPKFQYTIGAI